MIHRVRDVRCRASWTYAYLVGECPHENLLLIQEHILEAYLAEWQKNEGIYFNLIERAFLIRRHLFLNDQLASKSHMICPIRVIGEF